MPPVQSFGLTPPPVMGPAFGLNPVAPPPSGFQDALMQAMGQTQALNIQARSSVEQSLVGNDLTMVESFTAMREADLALRLMIQIRNKLLDAYQEIQQLRM
jgi:flagellar hook-basal body complex protein FliE